MNSYTDSPACALVATRCACCGRDLVDAVSVETGVGPECREKHGYNEAQGAPDLAAFWAWNDEPTTGIDPEAFEECTPEAAAHKIANALVYRIAAEQDGALVRAYTNALAVLGYTTLSARIAKRVATVKITATDDGLEVRAPYSETAVAELRRVPGRVWVKDAKVNRFPTSSRGHLWAALRKAYPGATACGPKGIFVIAA